MSNILISFWKENPQFWITPPNKQHAVDEFITTNFWIYNWAAENLIGQVIYLDQFSRHFARAGRISEEDVTNYRKLATQLISNQISKLEDFDETEIVFTLMPFKHLKEYDFIFSYIHLIWLDGRKICEFPTLQRFYIDTYKKAFTLDSVKAEIIQKHQLEPYDATAICDYYPDKYTSDTWNIDEAAGESLLDLLNFRQKVIISLSGGIDSMVLLALLKYKGVDVSAVHIVYGNRFESEDEYRFLAEFCYRLDVKLHVYRIKWLRRGEVDREFYEDMTRDLRFATYHACSEGQGSLEPYVILGHIKDDIVENIWTNIANCHHLGNLKKMETEEVQFGVHIMRPFLNVEKSEIYRISQKLGIPYLKNTTPSWSNRGKFREHFHKATIEQFGEGIDSKMIQFAEAIQAQNRLLNRLLYDPIYESFENSTVNITTAVEAQLDANSWLQIFETICHKYLGISRPSIRAVRDFCKRLKPDSTIEMGKHLRVKIFVSNRDYVMKLITR